MFENWKVELYTQAPMDSELLIAQGITPTTVSLDGEEITASENPGLMGRNR